MQKRVVLAVSVTLLLTSGAWAFIGQEQGFNIGAVNAIQWAGGVGSAEGSHQAMFGQEQIVVRGWGNPGGQQKETGVFTQVATASGGGPATINQTAQTAGAQQQGTAGLGTTQGQQMGVGFTTSIMKPTGPGAASAAQSFVGGQTQVLMTPTTLSTESQVVGVTEYASVVGGPQTDPSVSNNITINLGQGQMATVPFPPICNH